jgi:hypothetical protein
MSVILRDHLCDIILNADAPAVDKINFTKDSSCEEIKQIYLSFP